MYLTSLYHGLREYSPHGGRKRRKLDVSLLQFKYFLSPLYLDNTELLLAQRFSGYHNGQPEGRLLDSSVVRFLQDTFAPHCLSPPRRVADSPFVNGRCHF